MKRVNECAKPKPKRFRKSIKFLPEGSVISDFLETQWKVGPVIGRGGHGWVCLTEQNSALRVGDEAEFVMKVGRFESALFCELTAFFRISQPYRIKEWKTRHHLNYLGVVEYVSFGIFEHNHVKYEFVIMKRLGIDLYQLFEANGKHFPAPTVFMIGLRLMDSLEYLHSYNYVHADIKGSNILLDHKDPNQVSLVDYGLTTFYSWSNGEHRPYKECKTKVPEGTLLYTSRDAHKGAEPSRKRDLETLGYCMLQWLCSRLPWENHLEDVNYVRDQKILYMSNIPYLLQKYLQGKPYSAEFGEYLEYVANMGYEEEPDYDGCRQIFIKALQKLDCKTTDKLYFDVNNTEPANPMTSKGCNLLSVNKAEKNVQILLGPTKVQTKYKMAKIKKFRRFVEEPMLGKSLKCIPGITGNLLTRLEKDLSNCRELYRQFGCKYNKEDAFRSWLMENYNARESQARECARAFYFYSESHSF